jgi:hypothetical protein
MYGGSPLGMRVGTLVHRCRDLFESLKFLDGIIWLFSLLDLV